MAIDPDVLITAALTRVDDYSEQARTYASAAVFDASTVDSLSDYYKTLGKYNGGSPLSPPAFKPNVDLSVEMTTAFANAFGDFHENMTNGLADYLARFLPECVTTHTDDWICNTILTGGDGVPPDIEAAIWQRARARDTQEAARMTQEALSQFSSRGFSLPSGALAARVLEVQQEAANKGSTLSRDQAIKSFDVQLDLLKLAITEGVKVRIGMMGSLGEYMRAWLAPQTNAIDYANRLADAKAKLWASTSDYYRAMIQEADLGLKSTQIEATSYDTNLRGRLQITSEHNSATVNAALKAAEIMGSMAASAASSAVSTVGSEAHIITST